MLSKLSHREIKQFCKEEENAIYLDVNIYEGESQVHYLSLYLYSKYAYKKEKNEKYKQSFKDDYKRYYKRLNEKIKIYLKDKKINVYKRFYNHQIYYSCGVYGNTGQVHKFYSNNNYFYVGF